MPFDSASAVLDTPDVPVGLDAPAAPKFDVSTAEPVVPVPHDDLKGAWADASPWERLKLLFGSKGYGQTEVDGAVPIIGSEAAGTKGGAFTIPKSEGEGTGAGLINAANKFTSGMTSPENIGLLLATEGGSAVASLAPAVKTAVAARAASTAALGTFTAVGAKDTIEAVSEARRVYSDPKATDAEKADAIASAVLSGAMTGLAAKGTVDLAKRVPAPVERFDVDTAVPVKAAEAAPKVPQAMVEVAPEQPTVAAPESARQESISPEKSAAIKQAVADPSTEWQVTVQKPMVEGGKGFIQLDAIKDGENTTSSNIADVRAAGLEVPDIPEWVEQGQYSLPELKAMIERGKESPETAAAAGGDAQGKTSPSQEVVNSPTPAFDPESAAPVSEQPGFVTAIKNAKVDQERAARGLEPIMATARKEMGAAWDEAMAIVDKDPQAASKLADELAANPRAPNQVETSLLLQDRIAKRADFERSATDIVKAGESGDPVALAEARKRYDAASDVLQRTDEIDRLLGAESGRSLAARRTMAAEDYSLSALTLEKRAANDGAPLTPEQVAEVAETHAEFNAKQKALDDYLEAKSKEAGAEPDPAKVKSITERILAVLDKQADASRKRLSGKLFTVSPQVIYDMSVIAARDIAHGTVDLASWSKRMVDEFGEKVKPHLSTAWEKGSALLDEQLGKAGGKRESNRIVDYLERQKANLEKAIAEKTEQLRKDDVEAKKRKIDRPAHPTLEELKQQRDSLNEKIVNRREVKNESKEVLDQQKRQLASLDERIKEREERIKSGDVSNLTAEPAVSRPAIKAIEEAKQRMEALRKEIVEMRKKPDSQKAAEAAQRRLEQMQKDIADKESAIKSGDVAPEAQEVNRPLPPELEKAKQQLEALNKRIAEMRKGPPKPEERRLRAFKSRAGSQLKDLRTRIEEGNYAPKVKKPLHLDAEANRLQSELEQVKAEFKQGLDRDRYEKLSPLGKFKENALNTYDAARNLMTTGEFSFILRQGKFTTLSNPALAAKALPNAFKALLADETAARALDLEVMNHPDAAAAKAAKLHLVDEGAKLSRQEEIFASKWGEKIPLVRNFNQAGRVFLNKIRFDLFRKMRDAMDASPERDKQIARFINQSTGRGTLGSLEAAAVPLGRALFSPRYLASRLQLAVGESMWGGDFATRRAIAKEYAKFLTGLAAYYAALNLYFGAGKDDKKKPTVSLDPRSSDFGKVKLGNTRLDPLAGLAQVITFSARTATGEKTDSKGRVRDIRGPKVPFGGDKWSDVAANFARSKLHPVPGAIINLFDGTDLAGQPATPQSQALNFVTPLTYMDVYSALKEQDLDDATALSLLAILGEGLQTYGGKKTKPTAPEPAPK